MKTLPFLLAVAGGIFIFFSITYFMISLSLTYKPALTPEFAEKTFASAFTFTFATLFLIVGVIFLIWAIECKLKET
jgi:hypothetical protein